MQNNQKVLVTGASGFIGLNLVRFLKKAGYQLVTPNEKDGFDVTREKDVISLPKSDAVIHLAAMANPANSWKIPGKYFEVNINGTLNVLKYASLYQAKIVFLSSYAYGTPHYLPIDENHPVSAENPYAASKLAGEQLCYMYGKKAGFGVTILRLFNTYGPGQKTGYVIPDIISQLVNGSQVSINCGWPKRDFVYIEDVTEAIGLVLKHKSKAFRVYNIGSGQSVSIEQVCRLLIKLTGKDIKLIDKKTNRPNEIAETLADISKIKKDLGWKPKTTLEGGLKKTYDWYANRNYYS